MSHKSCCVVSCKNTGRKSACHFYKFPTASWKINQRKKWIDAVRRQNISSFWTPKAHDYICSDHFIGGQKSDIESSPSYIPTKFPTAYKYRKVNELMVTNRFKRLMDRRQNKKTSSALNPEPEVNELQEMITEDSQSDVNFHTFDEMEETVAQMTSNAILKKLSQRHEHHLKFDVKVEVEEVIEVNEDNEVIDDDTETNDLNIAIDSVFSLRELPNVVAQEQYIDEDIVDKKPQLPQYNFKCVTVLEELDKFTDKTNKVDGLIDIYNSKTQQHSNSKYNIDEVVVPKSLGDIEYHEQNQMNTEDFQTNESIDNLIPVITIKQEINDDYIQDVKQEDTDLGVYDEIDDETVIKQEIDEHVLDVCEYDQIKMEINHEPKFLTKNHNELDIVKETIEKSNFINEHTESTQIVDKDLQNDTSIIESPIILEQKIFSCDICTYKTKSKKLLISHLNVHKSAKKYSCSHCDYITSIKTFLNNHIRTHTGEKPFSCDFCKKKFTQKEHLNAHIRTHTGKRPFSCDFCKKKFKQKEHLNAHIRTHTGERPFSCEFCKKKFTEKGNLNRHIRQHTGERNFSCDVCEKKYTDKSHLNKHIRTHKRQKPS